MLLAAILVAVFFAALSFMLALVKVGAETVALSPQEADELADLLNALEGRVKYLTKELRGGSCGGHVHAARMREAGSRRFVHETWSAS